MIKTLEHTLLHKQNTKSAVVYVGNFLLQRKMYLVKNKYHQNKK